ncbi:MAG: CehA/McbA family metallohydrolase [Myxococcota bacterium]|nr:CehA/McbA family metallohydrolase [Myxococcota bacterium]
MLAACSGATESGQLALRIVDAATGEPVPARVELLDATGAPVVPVPALRLDFECVAAPLPDWLIGLTRSDRIENRHTGTTQFYLAGPAEFALPAGRHRLRVFRGIETEVVERELEIEAGAHLALEVALYRWADEAARGWYSVDDHLHITRLTPEDDRRIAHWMRAEDLRVANLLQMGTVDQLSVTPQHDFGDAGAFRDADTLLLAGQEHPRTHFLGHTITLGAAAPIDLRDTYIVYERFWAESRRLGGVSGFAHFGIGANARDGLAIDAPRGGISFLEVLQFEWAHYDVWYGLLDLGLRITPTAGTDFPCGMWSLPGRERFYARIDGPVTRASFVEAVRAGRTFVTNGPLLELRIDDAGIGDTLRLEAPASVTIRARVRFDPARDDVRRVEVLRNGVPIEAPPERLGPGELRIEAAHRADASAWYALRVTGDKVGEAPLDEALLTDWQWDLVADRITTFREQEDLREADAAARGRVRASAAHTAAVWVEVAGTPPLAARPEAAERARAALDRLDDLESRLADDRLDDQTIWDWLPYSDGVPAEHLRRNRAALLEAIADARRRYRAVVAQRQSIDGV